MKKNPAASPAFKPMDSHASDSGCNAASQNVALNAAARADGLHAGFKYLSLKADAIEGNTLTGDASGIGNLDSYNDVIFPDAFSDDVIDDFLSSGFIADGHDWRKIVAMPKVATVKGNTLYTECEWHSTSDAQALKTKCAERIANNLSVGLSIGFGMYAADCKSFPNGKALLVWADAQGYDMSLFDEEGIAACTTKCQAILKIAKLYEYSPVPVPANPNAWATSMKSAGSHEENAEVPQSPVEGVLTLSTKGQFLGDYVEASMTMAALSRLTDALYYNIFWDAVYYSAQPKADRREMLAGGLGEYADYALHAFDALITDDSIGADAEDAGEELTEALSAIKLFWPKPEEDSPNSLNLSLRAGERFATTLETARAAAVRVNERAAAIKDVRLKEGRKLSAATCTTLTEHRDALANCVATIDDLLAANSSSATEDTEGEMDDAEKAAGSLLATSFLMLRARQLQRRSEERDLFGIEDYS